MTMQVFVRNNCTVITAPVQRDIDGVPQRLHTIRVPVMAGVSSAAYDAASGAWRAFCLELKWPKGQGEDRGEYVRIDAYALCFERRARVRMDRNAERKKPVNSNGVAHYAE